MNLKKFLQDKKAGRRDFLVGAGTMIALPFLESLYCNNLYAATKAPLRVLFGHIDTGVDQIGRNGYAHQSVLDMFKPVSSFTNFYHGIDTDITNGQRHPIFIQNFACGAGKTSFDQYASQVTGKGSIPGVLAIAINGRLKQTNDWKVSKINGNQIKHIDSLKSILSNTSGAGGGVTQGGGNGIELGKPDRLKKCL